MTSLEECDYCLGMGEIMCEDKIEKCENPGDHMHKCTDCDGGGFKYPDPDIQHDIKKEEGL